MVVATLISIAGVLSEASIPSKTADVLEWLRKKLKQPTLQFQGKCVQEEHSFAFFAVPSEVEDEQTNQHMLPPPFHDDSFQGSIAVLKSANPNPDDYDRQASKYMDLKTSEYDEFYQTCTFNEEDEENEGEYEEDDGQGDPTQDEPEEVEEGEDRPTAASTTAGKPGAKKSGGAGAGNATSQAVKAINQSSEKSTLGDLDALSALKEKMEKGE